MAMVEKATQITVTQEEMDALMERARMQLKRAAYQLAYKSGTTIRNRAKTTIGGVDYVSFERKDKKTGVWHKMLRRARTNESIEDLPVLQVTGATKAETPAMVGPQGELLIEREVES